MHYKDNYPIKFKFLRKTYRSKKIDLRDFNDKKYNANIIHSDNESREAYLQILYERTDHFYSLFPYLFKKGKNILNYVLPYSKTNRYPDFSASKLIRIETDNGYWENGKQHIKLIFDKCYLHSDRISIFKYAEFVLSENSIWLINESFQFEWFEPENPRSLLYKPYDITKFNFGSLNFELEVKLKRDFDDGNNQWRLKRSLVFRVTPMTFFDKTEIPFIEDQINKLLLLLTFFQGRKVDWIYGKIPFKNGNVNIYKTSKKYEEVIITNTVQVLKEIRLVEFLTDCSFEQISRYENELNQIISQYVFSNSLNREAKFMILFNCVEMIRNLSIKIFSDKGKIIDLVDEYKFNVSKTKRDKTIKAQIKSISDIVDEDDREVFKKEASKKVSFIRKKQIVEQFLSFFKAIMIEPLDYNLDFKELIVIRNKLYHGSIINETIVLTDINTNLYKLS